MEIFKRLFGNKKQVENKIEAQKPKSEENSIIGPTLSFSIDDDYNGIISASSVGVSTGSVKEDFYVYEWFIKETGEVFYIGKGRGDRYKEFHERAYEAEKIRKLYETDTRFIGTGLTEDQAIELENKEMTRVLNETNDRLTNRITPLLAKRDNGYDRSPNTPELKFETPPYLYASEIEEHYFGVKPQAFDEVKIESLGAVVFITRSMRDEIEILYGGNLDKYKEETLHLLSMNGSRVLTTQFAKSVSAWIFIGDDYLQNYIVDQEKAMERLGRKVPTYHLLDVRGFLINKYGEVEAISKEEVLFNPVHKRVPLTEIKNLHDWSKGYNEGMHYWEQGEKERKADNIEKAIELFDKARYNGYDAPALYRSYAMAYRKLKDYDNEIAIIDEAIERTGPQGNTTIMELKVRREKSFVLKQKKMALPSK
ncbi:DNA polymerase III subunit epsilon [Sporosarcina ureae]|uniref:GIY-YIG nuclease family protein n=1 Tax=Sporosarcina TaxID=1569 RepID=UPI000A14F9A7|nr:MULTISPECIES: GIY-YIG nuclease family protein [Sporosarcina]ARJ40244.1 DNA polymerase III subunit epsilon [Sporosarcina ureae]PIC84670.1 DNA polymerase III subunit epsilon [Sporosarcina sp. P1]